MRPTPRCALKLALLALLLGLLALPSAARAGEPRLPKLAGVTLALTADEGWTRESATAPTLVRYRHEDSGVTAQLVAIDVGDQATRGSRSAQAVVTDWLGQLTATDPRIQTTALESLELPEPDGEGAREGKGGPLLVLRAELTFADRSALFVGFSSADLAAARGSNSAPDDRYAFVLLVEGPLAAAAPESEQPPLATFADAALRALVVPLE